jgi:uncharacterized protein (DUF1330 family)
MPKGYVYAEVNITDPEQYEKYRELAPASIASFGGKYPIRRGDPETLEGDRHPKLVVVLEFESRERAKEWYNSIAGARASCHRGRRQISGQSASLNSGLQEGGADHGAGNCQ